MLLSALTFRIVTSPVTLYTQETSQDFGIQFLILGIFFPHQYLPNFLFLFLFF